jgi:hypothetical protein
MPYSERYVAFIDILGFSDIVKRSETDSKLYDALVKTLSDIQTREAIEGQEDVDFRFQSFSDSIVLSSAKSSRGLAYLLTAIYSLTIELLEEELLIRGAIARGNLYHEKGVMFGPAFIEAYRIEQNITKYPRVLLSKDTYEDHKAGPKTRFAVRLSEDGPPYVYAFQMLEFMLNNNETRKEGIERAAKCRITIQSLLNRSIHNPRHYEKLRWLAILWNSTIAKDHRPRVERIIFPLQIEFDERSGLS